MLEAGNVKKIFAGIFVAVLLLLIGSALLKYINAFFGAFILAVLFSPVHNFFMNKFKLKKSVSAIFVILLTIIIIMIPLAVLLVFAIDQGRDIVEERENIRNLVATLDEKFPKLDISQKVVDSIQELGNFLASLLIDAFKAAGDNIITISIMYFILYYLLVCDERKLERRISEFIPFNKKNSEKLMREFENVTKSTIITTGLIAIVQGGILSIAYIIFGVSNPIILGFIAGILSFLPIVGPPLVWVPVGLIQLFNGNIVTGIVLLVIGAFVSTIDNYIRPVFQKKVGEMHPLVSLLGIFIGLNLFGLIGIVMGPLLLSYFLLSIRMFKDEYLM